ncbi:CU044_2847 family protein [Streptomyces sp. NPDC002685]|uniref:CU044_2847 family protein n=1 Tax=Streptomyces sp. NPDC002685 TaxID=3154540 RepID=UPI003321F847
MKDTELVELDLPEGGTVLVRAHQVADEEDGSGDGPTNVGLRETLSFSAVSSALRGVATDVHRGVAAAKPDSVEVEFGFELALKGSRLVCLLVDGDTKATIRVRLQWQKCEAPGGQ